MGTYTLSKEETKELLKEWLQSIEGEVHAKAISESWNELADENNWKDKLKWYKE